MGMEWIISADGIPWRRCNGLVLARLSTGTVVRSELEHIQSHLL